MRIAVVFDIHGNLPALDAVLADIAALGADAIVNLGDDFGPARSNGIRAATAAEVIERLGTAPPSPSEVRGAAS